MGRQLWRSRLYWTGPMGFVKKRGTIVIEFLEPIPPGLHRRKFMARLEAEIEERIQQMAARYRVPVEKFNAQLDERGGFGEIEEQILVGKTLDFLLANAKVEPTK